MSRVKHRRKHTIARKRRRLLAEHRRWVYEVERSFNGESDTAWNRYAAGPEW